VKGSTRNKDMFAPRDSNPDMLIQSGPSLPLIEVAAANSQISLRAMKGCDI
jgi:hypothetical protein